MPNVKIDGVYGETGINLIHIAMPKKYKDIEKSSMVI